MSYIGRQNLGGAYRQLDDISSGFDGSDTTHTMQVNSQNVTVGDVNQIILSLGGVIQKPGTDFTVSGSVLTFTTAPAANTSFFAILLGSDNGGTVTPTDASVTSAKLSGNLVTPGTLDVNGQELILDADADTSITADTDDQIDFKTGGSDRISIVSTAGANLQVADGIDLTDGNLKVASGHGIDFSATSDATGQTSELLDDYEEGTWTAAFSDGSTAYTMNNSYKVGRYVKIGDHVWIWGYFTVSDVDGGGANENTSTKITGLPYTMENNSENYSSVHVGYVNSFALPNALSVVMGYIEISNTYIYLVRHSSTDGTEAITGVHVSDGGTVMLAGMYKAS